ncbi:MAG TPA: TrbG/VirB9 family P-type conjugative transfer protein, partial [Polyangiales bacterium]|nr:TrbG/VirB9 family P-type conjugative transfer protein [Polyangiales bacterium]
ESMQRQRWLDVDREVELRRVDKIALEQAREYRTGEHARAPERGRDGRILLPFNGSPRVICAPKHVCDIELEEGEMIHNSALGNGSDEQGEWELTIAGTSTTPHLVVKPLVPNASTNLIVHGQTRVYNIELVSTASSRDDYMPFVAFKYPEDTKRKWAELMQRMQQTKSSKEGGGSAADRRAQESDDDSYTVRPERLNFNYTWRKDARWFQFFKLPRIDFMPSRVYDDGRKTFIVMPESIHTRSLPMLVIRDRGTDEVVNARVEGSRFVVDRLFRRAKLMIDANKRSLAVIIERTDDGSAP